MLRSAQRARLEARTTSLQALIRCLRHFPDSLAGRGPLLSRSCAGTVDTGLRRYDDGRRGEDHANLPMR